MNGRRDCQGHPEGDLSLPDAARGCDEDRREHYIHGRFLPIGFHMISAGKCKICERNQGYRYECPEQVNPRTSISPGAKYSPASPLFIALLIALHELLMFSLVGLLYVPFLNHGRIPIGSLGTYVHSFRFNDPVFATLERVAAPQLVVGLAVLVGFLTAIWQRSKATAWSSDAFAWPMAASLLCAPVVYPWYLLWLLPFLRSASTVPIIVWTVSIIPTYYVWHLRTLGRPWLVPGWIMLLEYGCVVMAGAMIALRGLRRA